MSLRKSQQNTGKVGREGRERAREEEGTGRYTGTNAQTVEAYTFL